MTISGEPKRLEPLIDNTVRINRTGRPTKSATFARLKAAADESLRLLAGKTAMIDRGVIAGMREKLKELRPE